MRNKRFEILLMKNTLAIAVPAIVVFAVLIFMFSKYPIFEQIRCVNIDGAENTAEYIESLYDAGTTNIETMANDLYYAGFDYYVDGKLKGAYYYSMEEKHIQIYLIKTQEPVDWIDTIHIKGKIKKDNISTEHIMNQFETENEFPNKLLDGYCLSYIISEPDYPYAFIAMVYVFFYIPIFICVLILVYAVLVWCYPSMHSQAKQLASYGNPGEVIKDISGQLRHHLIFKKNNIYITSDYMIVSYLTKTDVIKLKNIRYLSKNEEKGINNHRVFRLTMSDPEVLFYEVDFNSEDLIDDVILYICGINDDVKI